MVKNEEARCTIGKDASNNGTPKPTVNDGNVDVLCDNVSNFRGAMSLAKRKMYYPRTHRQLHSQPLASESEGVILHVHPSHAYLSPPMFTPSQQQ